MTFNTSDVIFVLLVFFSIFSFFVAALLLFAFKDNEKYSATSFAFGCFLAGCATLAISFKSSVLAEFPYRLGLFFTAASWVGFYYSFKILLGEKISFKSLAFRSALFACLYVVALKLIGYFFGVDSLPYFVAATGIVVNLTLAFWDLKVYKRYKLTVTLALATTHGLSMLGYLFVRFPEEEGLINLAAYGYMIALVMVRYVGMFSLLASVESITKGEMIAENHSMRAELAHQKAEQTETQLLSSLNALAKARDDETGNHIIRTQNYVRLLALRLRNSGHYTESLSDQSIELMFKAAPLHDIGKVGIPDRILLKNGSFTDEEWEAIIEDEDEDEDEVEEGEMPESLRITIDDNSRTVMFATVEDIALDAEAIAAAIKFQSLWRAHKARETVMEKRAIHTLASLKTRNFLSA